MNGIESLNQGFYRFISSGYRGGEAESDEE